MALVFFWPTLDGSLSLALRSVTPEVLYSLKRMPEDEEEEALVDAEVEEPEVAPVLPADAVVVSEASLVAPAVVEEEEEAPPAEVAALSELEDRAL